MSNIGLAEGTELLGEYHGSGYREPPHLIRRADGRMLEVSPLLGVLAAHLDRDLDLEEVARRVGADLGRSISAQSVGYLIDTKLKPLGVVAGDECSRPPSAARLPILGLSVKAGVLPKSAVRVMTGVLMPLFVPAAVVAVLASLLCVDGWLATHHSIGPDVRGLVLRPGLLLVVIGLTVGSGVFHELGHATASRYGGAEPGTIGAGIYLLWPVFYNDLNDSYRLTKAGRLRADLGGVYFNAVFILALAGVYGATGAHVLLVAIVVQHLAVAQQFLPFVRLDGYYLVSDLAGVPDLFGRIRPVVSGFLRGRAAAPEIAGLKPGARAIVTVWVLTTVPVLVGCAALLTATLPVALTGTRATLRIQTHALGQAITRGAPFSSLLSAVQILAVAVPLAGCSAVLLRTLCGCGRWAAGRRRRAGEGPDCGVCGCTVLFAHHVRRGHRGRTLIG